jgi:hypothetical protein
MRKPKSRMLEAFNETAPSTAEDEQMATMRIALQCLLHDQRKSVADAILSDS